jgi:spore maturation protein CgeB
MARSICPCHAEAFTQDQDDRRRFRGAERSILRIIYHGPMFDGAKSRQRAEAMAGIAGIDLIFSESWSSPANALEKLAWRIGRRIGCPPDLGDENRRLLALARAHRPDALFVEKGPLIRVSTLHRIREETGALFAYLSTDDILAPHHLTRWLRGTLGMWDIVFTPKTFGHEDLERAGVRNVVQFTNSFDPRLHRPLGPEEVGPDYEAFDIVFVGTYEEQRALSLVRLAEAGFRVVVYGDAAGALMGSWARIRGSGVELRPSAYGEAYVRACHHGKISLGFLRKLHRDTITSRSVELPAMGRPMLAEWSEDHDAHFRNGIEYLSFRDDAELIEKAGDLLSDDEKRRRLAEAGRRRCLASRYDSNALAEFFVAEIQALRA